MSQQPATSDNTVSREEILEVANLARLGVDESTADSYADDISKVLKLMDLRQIGQDIRLIYHPAD